MLGCQFFGKKPVFVHQDVKKDDQSEIRFIEPEIISAGGNVVLLPFSAGTNVEASQTSERMALRIVKGFSEVADSVAGFDMVFDGQADESDIIITGRITAMHKVKKFKFFDIGQELQVQGKVLQGGTDRTLALFKIKERSLDRKQTFEELGFVLGQRLAKRLLANN